jgi:hypothetical protein
MKGRLIDDASTFLVQLTLLSNGLAGPLGPFDDSRGRVGALVKVKRKVFSAFLVIGRKSISPGGSERVELIVGRPHPDLREGDTVKILDGAKIVGTASILRVLPPGQTAF